MGRWGNGVIKEIHVDVIIVTLYPSLGYKNSSLHIFFYLSDTTVLKNFAY